MMDATHFQKGGNLETGALIDRRKRLWSSLGMPRAARIAPGGLVQARGPAANRGRVGGD
jgi:hypothetical protein